MKKKILIVCVLVIAFIVTANVLAMSQQGSSNETSTQNQQQTQTSNQGEESQLQVQAQEQIQNEEGAKDQVQSQGQSQNEESGKSQGQSQGQPQQSKGKASAEEHRSKIANFIQSLNKIADKDSGVGQQVRNVAQQQNQSMATTVQAMEKVETRSRIKTFLIGSDYKNLGALRSEMVQTRNRLEQLNKLMENIQNEGDKTELQNQIQTLESEQMKIESFIKEQEQKVSMFGWLMRMLSGYKTIS